MRPGIVLVWGKEGFGFFSSGLTLLVGEVSKESVGQCSRTRVFARIVHIWCDNALFRRGIYEV